MDEPFGMREEWEMGQKMAGMAAAGVVAAMLTGGALPATAATATVTQVPCSAPALASAVSGAASGATLSLAKTCTYVLTAGLPTVAQNLTINGNGATLRGGTLTITAGTVTLNKVSFTSSPGAIIVANLAKLNVTGGVFSDNTANNGPAINNTGSSVVQVTGASFIDNTADGDGGAMYVDTALGDLITHCSFVGNTATGSGGAYWDWSNGTEIRDSTFRRNTATTGGALAFDDQGPGITGTVVHGNSAAGDGGGIYDGSGGAPIPIIDSKITGNHAGGAGGGIDEQSGGGVSPVSDTVIAYNSATDGGGINDGNGVYIRYADDTISGNHASGDGGGINAIGGGVVFTGTTVSGNYADGDGGGIDSNIGSRYPPFASFTDSTISGNHAGDRGGGLYNQGDFDASGTQITGNQAVGGWGWGWGGGGGIYNDGTEATVTLTDSPPTGNNPDNCEPLNSITGCTG